MRKCLQLCIICLLSYSSLGQYCVTSSTYDNFPNILHLSFGEIYNENEESFNVYDTINLVEGISTYFDYNDSVIQFHKNRENYIKFDVGGSYKKDIDVSVFIDWNRDNDFDDEGELLFIKRQEINYVESILTISDDIDIGNYQMRFRYADSYYEVDIGNSCGNEMETSSITIDYTLTIADWKNVLNQGSENVANELGFEEGHYNLWEEYIGFHERAYLHWPDVDHIGCCPFNETVDFGLNASVDAEFIDGAWRVSRHNLMGGENYRETQQNEPTFIEPVSWGGDYFIRIGNREAGGEAERLERTFRVEESTTLFHYAYRKYGVMSGHGKIEDGYFEVTAFDENGRLVRNSKMKSLDNFESNTDPDTWRNDTIDLSEYVGKDITIRLTNADCAHGAHYNYSYFDYEFLSTKKIIANRDTVCTNKKVLLRAPYNMKSYLWGDGSTEYSREVFVNETTEFNLTYVNQNEETIEISKEIVVDDLVGGCLINSVEQILDDEFEVFPNPSSDWLTINAEGFTNSTLKIMDASGREVLNQQMKTLNFEKIDLSQLKKGIYIISIQTKSKLARKKIILQ